MNATVGSAVNGAAATIQNTDKLKIAISIAEYDIGQVKVGMKAIITSDVMDGEVNGTYPRSRPLPPGRVLLFGFTAEITVDDENSGQVGTNAKAKIILSTTENVFTVPLDAIEEKEDGTSVICEDRRGLGRPALLSRCRDRGHRQRLLCRDLGQRAFGGHGGSRRGKRERAADTADPFQIGGAMRAAQTCR